MKVDLRLVTDASGFTAVTTDLGYEVRLSMASMAVDDLQFTLAGEAHTSQLQRISNWLIPVAHAHPGHSQGGDVTGELPGHFVLRFEPGKTNEVGTATLLVGTYHGLNLTLASASEADVDEDDPLRAHSAYLTGTAKHGAAKYAFEVAMDAPEGRQLTGIPFAEQITESTERRLALRLSPRDSLENDTLFDGVDFSTLDADGDGKISLVAGAIDEASADAYNRIHRAFQSHDHFIIRLEE